MQTIAQQIRIHGVPRPLEDNITGAVPSQCNDVLCLPDPSPQSPESTPEVEATREERAHRMHEQLIRSGVLFRGLRIGWLEHLGTDDINSMKLVILPLAQRNSEQRITVYRDLPQTEKSDEENTLGYAMKPLTLHKVMVVWAKGHRFTTAKVRYYCAREHTSDAFVKILAHRLTDGHQSTLCRVGADCDVGLNYLSKCCLCGECAKRPEWLRGGWVCKYIQRRM